MSSNTGLATSSGSARVNKDEVASLVQDLLEEKLQAFRNEIAGKLIVTSNKAKQMAH